MSKSPYTDVVLNAFKSVQAWKSLSLVLVGVLLVETAALLYLAADRTVILIPQQLANAKEPVRLSLGAPFTPAYMSDVATGDAHMLLSWTPDNIEQQYSSFLARLTPGLHSVQKESLLAEAKVHQADGLTQSFHVTRRFVKDNKVTLHGVLIRAVGGREVFRGTVIYDFVYENGGNGLLLLSSVSQPEGRQ